MDFSRSVFINCPFDEEYWPLFRPLVFTVIRLGCVPRYSLERSDSSEARIGKITALIRQSRFGVHDLSRCVAKEKGEMFRLNMPLELGLDMGAKTYGAGKLKTKRILILEEERFRFQAAISDIANSDIKAHKAQPDQVVRVVRDWLVQEAAAEPISPTVIWYEFNDCLGEIHDELRQKGYSEEDIRQFPEHELIQRMVAWTKDFIARGGAA